MSVDHIKPLSRRWDLRLMQLGQRWQVGQPDFGTENRVKATRLENRDRRPHILYAGRSKLGQNADTLNGKAL
jgi:hypothetical protein